MAFSASLAVLLPELSTRLAAPEAIQRAAHLAQRLAPLSRGGLECRLDEDPGALDLHQRLVAGTGDARILADHIERLKRAGELAPHETWVHLQGFLREWSSKEEFNPIEELWLEYDQPLDDRYLPLPSVFVGLPQHTGLKGSERFATVKRAMERLMGCPTDPVWAGSLERCISLCPPTAFVSHAGAMLSRLGSTIRLNIKRLAPDELGTLLEQLDWQGDIALAVSQMRKLVAQVDRVTLCLDAGAAIGPRIGFECILMDAPAREPRWAMFLNYLVDEGLCSPDRRDGCLAWAGTSDPTSSPLTWPASLLHASLLHPLDHFTSYDRRFSHVKVSCDRSGGREAKGYLSFSHEWLHVRPLPPVVLPFDEADPRSHEPVTKESWLEQVRAYYDQVSPAYLSDLGSTIQSSLVLTADGIEDPEAHTRYLARQAGIRPGQKVLDAGCGVCGPAMVIAQSIANLSIDAITLSGVQARIASERIEAEGLSRHISVHIGDYHSVPFADEHFDVVYFFESSGYSHDLRLLFAEMFRVLKPGGTLYIKDIFRRAGEFSAREAEEMALFDRIYVYRTRTIVETTGALDDAGFDLRYSRNMTGMVGGQRWLTAMGIQGQESTALTHFGTLHYYPFQYLPVFTGEINASKPMME